MHTIHIHDPDIPLIDPEEMQIQCNDDRIEAINNEAHKLLFITQQKITSKDTMVDIYDSGKEVISIENKNSTKITKRWFIQF